jgi:hypothetical protein
MPDFKRTTMASRAYDKAHAAHYATKDLRNALGLYKCVLADYPDTQEADYSRTQMQNIVKGVVPNDELLVAQVELALVHLEHSP